VDADAGFGVVNLERLLHGINAPPGQGGLPPNEVWIGDSDPSAVRAAIERSGLAPQLLLDVESEQFAQQEDPLVAAGWQGILFIAFGAVLLLSAIGFLVYSYLTAQERSLEFAILRTLGFSGTQIFGVVAFEHVFVIVTGMGLGTGVGLQVGRMMLRFLGTDEVGATVLPPLQLGVSWPAVALAWTILGAVFAATIGAVVLLYVRLQVHRALRIGDV
jgi:ABC-type antimicrobial peptide transport system permease subunit